MHGWAYCTAFPTHLTSLRQARVSTLSLTSSAPLLCREAVHPPTHTHTQHTCPSLPIRFSGFSFVTKCFFFLFGGFVLHRFFRGAAVRLYTRPFEPSFRRSSSASAPTSCARSKPCKVWDGTGWCGVVERDKMKMRRWTHDRRPRFR